MADVPEHLKKMQNPHHQPKYERSFDGGTTYEDCSLRDIQNAFLAAKSIVERLENGDIAWSKNGVFYRKKETA